MKPWVFAAALALVAVACAPLSPPDVSHQAASPFRELNVEEARAAHQKGWTFLDARLRDAFLAGHVPGALTLPIQARDGEERLMDFLTGPHGDPHAPVVVYGGGCCNTEDLDLAQRLKEAGFQNLHVFRDGFPAWVRAGHPTTSEVP